MLPLSLRSYMDKIGFGAVWQARLHGALTGRDLSAAAVRSRAA